MLRLRAGGRVSDVRRELRLHHAIRGLATGAIAAGVFDICLYAVILPAVFPVVAVCAVIMIFFAVLAVRRQTRAIRRLQVSAQLEDRFLQARARRPDPVILPAGGVSMELAGARLVAAFGPCAHPEAVPVDLPVTKERVAWLCPQCDAQLPGEWAL
jgi:hypothetical protein